MNQPRWILLIGITLLFLLGSCKPNSAGHINTEAAINTETPSPAILFITDSPVPTATATATATPTPSPTMTSTPFPTFCTDSRNKDLFTEITLEQLMSGELAEMEKAIAPTFSPNAKPFKFIVLGDGMPLLSSGTSAGVYLNWPSIPDEKIYEFFDKPEDFIDYQNNEDYRPVRQLFFYKMELAGDEFFAPLPIFVIGQQVLNADGTISFLHYGDVIREKYQQRWGNSLENNYYLPALSIDKSNEKTIGSCKAMNYYEVICKIAITKNNDSDDLVLEWMRTGTVPSELERKLLYGWSKSW